jgi:hypothetical protein
MGPEDASDELQWPVPTLQLALQSLVLPGKLTVDTSIAYSMKLSFQRSHSVKSWFQALRRGLWCARVAQWTRYLRKCGYRWGKYQMLPLKIQGTLWGKLSSESVGATTNISPRYRRSIAPCDTSSCRNWWNDLKSWKTRDEWKMDEQL